MRNLFSTDTIVAVATPPGEGGIAVLRVSGAESHNIADACFRLQQGKSINTLPGYTTRYGHLLDPKTQAVVDDGLITVFHAPRSYTGEDVVEISCHGGRATTQMVLGNLIKAGARLAEPGEFTQRAFLNGKLDLAQAEAVADLIRAETEGAQRLARRQLEGYLSRAVQSLRQELIGILAAIEVTIDFSDEVGELDYPNLQARISQARELVESLLETAEEGRILREGLRVTLVGRPNAGKSSLFNRLLRANRAIVTPQPGTTRDRLEESLLLDGIRVVLNDVAGIRETDDLVEREGVARAEETAQNSDIVLLVLDTSTGLTDDDRQVVQRLQSVPKERMIVVLNKQDIAPPMLRQEMERVARAEVAATAFVQTSAANGEGIEELQEAMLAAMGREKTAVRHASAVVSNTRHREALTTALVSLQEAEITTINRLPGDFIAIDVRGGLDALGLITGETVTDDIIHRIFKDFCVGK